MYIKAIHIGEYKNLKNLTLSFDRVYEYYYFDGTKPEIFRDPSEKKFQKEMKFRKFYQKKIDHKSNRKLGGKVLELIDLADFENLTESEKKKLKVVKNWFRKKRRDYINDVFFGNKKIDNISTIIGENRIGKSNLIEGLISEESNVFTFPINLNNRPLYYPVFSLFENDDLNNYNILELIEFIQNPKHSEMLKNILDQEHLKELIDEDLNIISLNCIFKSEKYFIPYDSHEYKKIHDENGIFQTLFKKFYNYFDKIKNSGHVIDDTVYFKIMMIDFILGYFIKEKKESLKELCEIISTKEINNIINYFEKYYPEVDEIIKKIDLKIIRGIGKELKNKKKYTYEFCVQIKFSVFRNLNLKLTIDHEEIILKPYPINFQFYNIKNGKEYTLSSGEKRMIQLARFIHVNSIRGILLLDEPDNLLHPEWQRKLVTLIIDVANYNKKNGLQIIMTTHSPIMLSDLHQSSVIRLQKVRRDESNKDEFVKKKETINGRKIQYYHEKSFGKDGIKRSEGEVRASNPSSSTFGANIFQLYKDSFFLENMIGEFANTKIQKLITKIKRFNSSKNYSNRKEILEEINIIGDPHIRQILINEIDDKQLKKSYFEKELEKLKDV